MAEMSEFKKKLRAGEYVSLTGAKRAIGKMKGWSEPDRNKARAAAEKYFEGAEPPPKKKAAKKKAKRKLHPRVAKKAAAKAGKKVAKKRAKAGKKAAKAGKKAQARRARVTQAAEKPSLEQRVALAAAAVGTCGAALETLEKCHKMHPNADIVAHIEQTMNGLTQLVRSLTQDVSHALSPEQLKGNELFSKVAAVGGNGGAAASSPQAAPQGMPATSP